MVISCGMVIFCGLVSADAELEAGGLSPYKRIFLLD
jgi:hypothetical protein